MKIKQVEELVGITRKNIRFYEGQGLLKINRAENGYREYGLDDVRRLQQIKLLRKLSMPLNDIRRILSDECSLEDCLEKQIHLLKRQEEKLENQQKFIRQMLEAPVTLQSLDVDDCLIKVEQLEREGIIFMNEDKVRLHRRNAGGAVIGSGIVIALMLAVILMLVWAYRQDPNPASLPIITVMVVVFAAIIVVAIVALTWRFREIKEGEEDEAAKY